MKCPYCGEMDNRVINSRLSKKGESVRRRRECQSCQKRFTTFEIVDHIPIVVIKTDQKREIFDRQKLIKGLLKACHKCPISLEEMEKMVDGVEKELNNSMLKEVSSKQIGEMVLKRLRNLDEVAYVRFASVYRSFKDVSEFGEELKELLKRG